MTAFDLLAHLPHDEAFGLALAEAMASGLPVVASDAEGCRDVVGVKGGQGGLIVGAGDVAGLACALAPFLDPVDGAARRIAQGRKARQAAHQFSRVRQIDQLMDLYADLCLPAIG